jgi:hypothetical protein
VPPPNWPEKCFCPICLLILWGYFKKFVSGYGNEEMERWFYLCVQIVSQSTDPLSITVKLADFGTSRFSKMNFLLVLQTLKYLKSWRMKRFEK